jgi:hypothetical protein
MCPSLPPMLRVLTILCVTFISSHATPSYFGTVANQALRLKGGAVFGPDLNLRAISELEQQVKRVMGADPASALNISALRERPDPELLRILFLAVLGNFTSAVSGGQPPCRLVIDTHTGLVSLEDSPALASLALQVVLMLLVAVQFKQWVEEVRSQRNKPNGADTGRKGM